VKTEKAPTKALAALEKSIREHSLSYPEVTEDFPWGHPAIKVRGKMFSVWSIADGELTLSVKLPQSKDSALMLPFAAPTGYGMGKSGWVTLTLTGKEKLPIGIIKDWIDESYRAIAPKKLSKALSPRK
jgi:predicted DNA-binding protein (MmcQ/YjbR family)